MSAESGGRHPLLVWAWSLLRLKFVGLAFGALFFCLSLTPSLVPREWLFQGLIGGVDAAVAAGAVVDEGRDRGAGADGLCADADPGRVLAAPVVGADGHRGSDEP